MERSYLPEFSDKSPKQLNDEERNRYFKILDNYKGIKEDPLLELTKK
jgi:hypothetical protein